jgi:hypothetical protein
MGLILGFRPLATARNWGRKHLSPHRDRCSHCSRCEHPGANSARKKLYRKLIETLRPSPFDQLQEPTLNAALALIDSPQPRSEMEALMAVQIVATGLSGLRFLRQSQHHMDESFIDMDAERWTSEAATFSPAGWLGCWPAILPGQGVRHLVSTAAARRGRYLGLMAHTPRTREEYVRHGE